MCFFELVELTGQSGIFILELEELMRIFDKMLFSFLFLLNLPPDHIFIPDQLLPFPSVLLFLLTDPDCIFSHITVNQLSQLALDITLKGMCGQVDQPLLEPNTLVFSVNAFKNYLFFQLF